MTVSVNRLHRSVAVKNTAATDTTQKVNRVHRSVVVKNTTATDNAQKVGRVHRSVIVKNTTATDNTQKVARVHRFVVVRKTPIFSIGGAGSNELHVSNQLSGVWPVKIKGTDSLGVTFTKTFTITIT